MWPALAQFGVYPWNFERLSLPELNVYLDSIAERAWSNGDN